jgi:hypothetical protein
MITASTRKMRNAHIILTLYGDNNGKDVQDRGAGFKGSVAGSSGHNYEPSGTLGGGESVNYLSVC